MKRLTWIMQTLKAISSVAIYGWTLMATADAVNTRRGYHHEAAGGLKMLVLFNVLTLGAVIGLPLFACLSRRRGFAAFVIPWAAAAAMGCLQVFLLIELFGLL